MGFKLKCPSCRGSFAWNPKEGMPDLCALCGEHVGHDTAEDIVFCPAIRTNAKTRAVDDVYRQMEAGSITRAQIAAEMTGAPVSEMSGLKITDMRDNQRQGDIAAVLPNNPVSELMRANPNVSGMQRDLGLQMSQQTMIGSHPSAGARMRTALQNVHPDMVRKHCIGTDAYTRQPIIPSTDVVSERHAAETYQPGYRRRG
jgi:hypothetical protein